MSSSKYPSSFFQTRRPWWFNSADMAIYGYLLVGVIAAFLALILLISLLLNLSGQPSSDISNQSSAPASPAATESQPSAEIIPDNTVSSTPVMTAENSGFAEAYNSALTQPTYELRQTALALILEKGQATGPQIAQTQQKIAELKKKIEKNQKTLALAERYIDLEYYSSSIQMFQGLIKTGPELGAVYEGAQKGLEKAYLKKIDYYLVKKASLALAEKTLKEAQAAGVQSSKLDEYATQIQNLKKAVN